MREQGEEGSNGKRKQLRVDLSALRLPLKLKLGEGNSQGASPENRRGVLEIKGRALYIEEWG